MFLTEIASGVIASIARLNALGQEATAFNIRAQLPRLGIIRSVRGVDTALCRLKVTGMIQHVGKASKDISKGRDHQGTKLLFMVTTMGANAFRYTHEHAVEHRMFASPFEEPPSS